MHLSRRNFLRMAGLVAASATTSACVPNAAQLSPSEPSMPLSGQHFQALNRLSFGATLDLRQRSAELGLEGWLAEQLDPAYGETIQSTLKLGRFDIYDLDMAVLEAYPKREVVEQLKQSTMLKRLYSRRQLYEVMVEFWSDHFNIDVNKGPCWYLKVSDDRDVIRKHALGNFRDMLHASAKSPAMLIYLDNQVNVKEAPNENYAREIMELHSLGVDGGYTQADVMALARCFTGWSVDQRNGLTHFKYHAAQHDHEPKVVLNQSLPAGGMEQAETVIDMLAEHPSTAKFIATKLVRRFICDNPLRDEPDLVAKATQAFMRSDGDIPTMLKVVIEDGIIGRNTPLPPKFKRPTQFLTTALRLTGAQTNAPMTLDRHLSSMGQHQFEWPTPDGAPDVAAAWSTSLMPRWRAAVAIARNEVADVRIEIAQDSAETLWDGAAPSTLIDHYSQRLLGTTLNDQAKTQIAAQLSGLDTTPHDIAALTIAGLIASPAFQYL